MEPVREIIFLILLEQIDGRENRGRLVRFPDFRILINDPVV
jgi:hypothetical protein